MDPFTPREVEILRELADGARVKLIAKRLFISETTVRFHLRNIFSKLGVHSQAELIERLDSLPGLRVRADREGDPADALVSEFDKVHGRMASLARDASAGYDAQSIKDAVRACLPFDAQRRADWATFFRVWSHRGDDPAFDDARARGRRVSGDVAADLVIEFQNAGVIGGEHVASEVVDRLFELTIAAAALMMFEGSPDPLDTHLQRIDEYIDSIVT